MATPLRLPEPIQALVWQDVDATPLWRWLLPAAAVLEVLRCEARPMPPRPQPLAPALEEALVGVLHWHQRPLPLLRLSGADGGTSAAPTRTRAVVCPTLDPACALDAVAFAAQGVPGLVTLRDGEPAPVTEALPALAATALRLGEAHFAVPDLAAIATALTPLAAILEKPRDEAG
ncbi:hypothetical protein CKO31_10655 [Thiohalocapsa halophila]|uniref:Uncharacterized protein n=1 Tax=Thiohalocapsa halophila TaxID=69359 RepID=A0ABS1CGY9_9GAMM|nr:hypothetical protein [Thiohalocapsa halophila]MBK1631190.1 hypothetical protein [Thiohalocapsa halophila]